MIETTISHYKILKRFVRSIAAICILLASTATGSACPECRAQVRAGIYNQDFLANLFILLLPVLILSAIGVSLYYADEITERLKGRTINWRT